MIKPIWAAVAGVGLLGTAGVAGAVIVASSGGEDEVAFQPQPTLAPETVAPSPVMDTPSPYPEQAPGYPLPVPSFVPVATCLPSVSAPGTKTWRWGDVTIVTSEGNGLHAGGLLGPEDQPVMAIFSDADSGERVVVDAFTGQLVSAGPEDDPVFEKQAEFAAALATLSICAFDPRTALWPYTGPAPTGPRLSLGKITFLQPDPASGVQWNFEIDDPGGMFLLLQTARSKVAIDAETGMVSQETARIHPDDEDAFGRYLATIRVVES